MTRLRYIVDRGVGPKGGRRDVPSTFMTALGARSSAAEREPRFRADKRRTRGRVVAVDLDMLIDIEADADEQHAYHDRMLQYHAGEMQRLKPSGGAGAGFDLKWLTSDDLGQLRQAAKRWIAWHDDAHPPHRLPVAGRMLRDVLRRLLDEGKL